MTDFVWREEDNKECEIYKPRCEQELITHYYACYNGYVAHAILKVDNPLTDIEDLMHEEVGRYDLTVCLYKSKPDESISNPEKDYHEIRYFYTGEYNDAEAAHTKLCSQMTTLELIAKGLY